jgi:hypothetical protein
MAHAVYTAVLTGPPVPLRPAPSALEEWRTILPPDVLDPAHPDSPLHCYHEVHGYRFAWGQVLEGVGPPAANGPRLLTWDFILIDAQQQYHEEGGNLEELSDMALLFLDTYMPRHAPRWLHYHDGTLPAAFAFLVASPQSGLPGSGCGRFLPTGCNCCSPLCAPSTRPRGARTRPPRRAAHREEPRPRWLDRRGPGVPQGRQ